MNFNCEELTINDDPDFGCTIKFSDSKETDNEFTPIEELLHPKDKYLLIQRSYPEDEYENDWYTVESSESDISLSYKDNIYVRLRKDLIEINWSGEQLKIVLSLPDKEYRNLEKTIKSRFKDRLVLL